MVDSAAPPAPPVPRTGAAASPALLRYCAERACPARRRGVEPLELTRVDDAAAVRLAQLVAIDVRDVAHVPARAHRAPEVGGIPDVAGGPQQLRMGVADVEAGDRAAFEIAEQGPTGQRV